MEVEVYPAPIAAGLPVRVNPPPVAPPKPRPVTPPPTPAPKVESPKEVSAPPPQLGQIFTAAQRNQYTSALDQSLERVRQVLLRAAGRSLTPEQRTTVERIRTFQQQAQDARNRDLVAAVNLARRADLLAQDLATRLR